MPRKKQPPRLYFREDEGAWVIRDGTKAIRTGCGAADSRRAEEALSKYLAEKFSPAIREHSPARVTVDEVLAAYGREHAPNTKDPARIAYAISALMTWWSGKTLAEVRGSTCRAYAAARRSTPRANMANAKTEARRTKTVGDGTIRRELGTLSAAIKHWHAEHGPLDAVPVVTFPAKPEPKPDVLDRQQMARLVAGALGFYRVSWSDISTRRQSSKLCRDHDAINRHTARFIVIGRYTANRPGATLGLMWMPNTEGGWPDFKRELLFRKGEGVAETNKRRPSVRLGRAALAHFARWNTIDARRRDDLARKNRQEGSDPVTTYLHVVTWRGEPLRDIGKSFATALDYAGLPRTFTPHILRHTRVTWWVEAGLPIEEVAAAAGMTVQMVEDVYWHRSPNFQKRAADA